MSLQLRFVVLRARAAYGSPEGTFRGQTPYETAMKTKYAVTLAGLVLLFSLAALAQDADHYQSGGDDGSKLRGKLNDGGAPLIIGTSDGNVRIEQS